MSIAKKQRRRTSADYWMMRAVNSTSGAGRIARVLIPSPADMSATSYIDIWYILAMIKTIANRATQDIYDGVDNRYARIVPKTLHGKARRLLDRINAAPRLEALRTPPGNRLEKLRGGLEGYWSLRINAQWRIVFRWEETDALDVAILDYHG